MNPEIPEPDALKQQLAGLTDSQRARLAQRLAASKHDRRSQHGPRGIPRIEPGHTRFLPDAASYPASAGQQRLWFLDRLSPHEAAYNLPTLWRLRGVLDVEALHRSVELMVNRHDALRTRIVLSGDDPVQMVDPPDAVELPVTDVSAMPEAEREKHAHAIAQTEAWRPFDLETGPLFRAHLIRLEPSNYLLLFSMHHIVSDGWSERVWCRELSGAYNAFATGQTPELPPLAIQYADYALWQRECLLSGAFGEQLSYWKEKLAGVPALALPADRANLETDSHEGAHVAVELPPDLLRSVEQLGQREGATMFMVLLAAFQLLLHRCTGQEDIAIGTPVAGRVRTELEELIGFFVNTLVLRADLSGQPTFLELLERVRETVLGASAHRDVPFEKLVEVLSPSRDTRRNPLFDVMINLSPRSSAALGFHGVAAQSVPLPSAVAKLAMALSIRPRPEGLELDLGYQCNLFSSVRAAGLLEQYTSLLEQVVAEPGRSISSYSLVTKGARAVLPDPTVPIDVHPQQSVMAQIAAWAQSSPARIAVQAAGRDWTYAELTARALSLATTLREMGIGPGDVVAIDGPRSFGVIAAMLGVLMSDGAFLTIDPVLPTERKRLMLREARVKVICRLDASGAIDFELLPSSKVDLPGGAYVFFTSGSTGLPKAVLGSHQGLSHFLSWQRDTFSIGSDDRVSQLIGLTFDPLLRDVFLPLTSGGVLCVPAEQDLPGAVNWLKRERVTVVHTTPTVMQSWLNEVRQPIPLESLRWLFVAGEPLPGTLIERWRQLVPGPAQIVNLYGPTETTMARCFYQVPTENVRGTQPVGRSVADSQALVLNVGGGLCGLGETGEIVLRTPYRSLGYLNLPDENRRRFRPNPFRNDPSDLLYFTGDRGRYREDGILEIAGRVDDQLKIRGVRVEPGEVTAVLATHDGVRHCTVVGSPGDHGQHHLVAFVVRHSGRQLEVRELQGYLADRLPPAFVPGAIVFLDKLPVLPNGKIDQNALRGWKLPASVVAPPEPAGDLLEVKLLHIWEEVLGRHGLGLDDNFFEMGGYSLLAVRLFAEIERALGFNLPLATLFHAPSVRTLAEALRQCGWTPPWQSLVAIQPGGARPPLYVVHGVGGNILGFRDLAVHLGNDQPTFGLQSRGLDGKSPPCFTIEEMAEAYMREILSLQPVGPYHLCGLSFGGRAAFEVAQQLLKHGHQVGVVALLDASPRGYAEWLPFPERARERAGFWKRRIGGHLRDLRTQPSWIEYVRRKMKTLRRRLRSRTWQSRYRDHAAKGEPLPQELRDVREANYLAARNYVPKPYSGKVTLFQAMEHTPSHWRAQHQAWSHLAAGGVEVHHVPGNHVSLIHPPHVEGLAQALRAVLDAYQS